MILSIINGNTYFYGYLDICLSKIFCFFFSNVIVLTMDTAGEVITVTSPTDDEDKQSKSKQYLIAMLDRSEMIIENIRKEALKMAEDLDNVYNNVDAVRNSKSLSYLSEGKF